MSLVLAMIGLPHCQALQKSDVCCSLSCFSCKFLTAEHPWINWKVLVAQTEPCMFVLNTVLKGGVYHASDA